VIQRETGRLEMAAHPVESMTFEGLRFIRATLGLSPPENHFGDPWERLDQYDYASFRLYFQDPATGNTVSGMRRARAIPGVYIDGSILLPDGEVNVPEPAHFALVLLAGVSVFVVRRRLKCAAISKNAGGR
jgi:hypothetical protein